MVNLGLRDDTRVRGTGWPSGLSARSSFPHSQGTTARATQYVLRGGGGIFSRFLVLKWDQENMLPLKEAPPSGEAGGTLTRPRSQSRQLT